MRFHSTVSLRALCVVAAVAPVFACEPNAGPSRLTAPLVASRSAATEELASPGWQAIEANLVAQANLAAVVSTRAYSLLGVAQYLAVQRTEGSRRDERSRDASDAGAVAGASAVVLSYLFPSQAQALEDTVKAQRGGGPGFARGEVIGRAVGAEIVARAQADGFSTPFTRTIPVGAGFWVSNTTPATVAGGPLPGVRPWFLTSARQFRPGPPPAFGSRGFLAGLAEIRHLSDTRTAELRGITSFYDLVPAVPRVEIGHTQYGRRFWGGPTNPACKLLMLGHAFEVRFGKDDRRLNGHDVRLEIGFEFGQFLAQFLDFRPFLRRKRETSPS